MTPILLTSRMEGRNPFSQMISDGQPWKKLWIGEVQVTIRGSNLFSGLNLMKDTQLCHGSNLLPAILKWRDVVFNRSYYSPTKYSIKILFILKVRSSLSSYFGVTWYLFRMWIKHLRTIRIRRQKKADSSWNNLVVNSIFHCQSICQSDLENNFKI